MAESWVARESEKFMQLPVDERDLEAAEKLLELVRAEKLSRKEQSDENSIEPIIKEARDRGRKVIFYGGQNDFQTGMLPSFLPEAKIHSPVFVDTIDALQCLAFLAEKNNWHIIFKPHPMVVKWHKDAAILTENRVTTVLDADIFECMEKCDLTATIVSQLSYMALIHGRPSVLLGRNQLSGKGCAYEVGSEMELEPTLRKALEEGITDSMRRSWMRHAAQLLRHYLYSFEEATRPIMGRDVGDVARYLLRRYELPELSSDGSRLGEDDGRGIFGSDCHSRFHLLKLRLACRALSVANSTGGKGNRKGGKRALARPPRSFMGKMYLKQVCGLK